MTLIIDQVELNQLPVVSDPDILSGEPVFRGTRVPVAALLENLEAGLTVDEFLDTFPSVSRQQAIRVLEFSKSTLQRLGAPT